MQPMEATDIRHHTHISLRKVFYSNWLFLDKNGTLRLSPCEMEERINAWYNASLKFKRISERKMSTQWKWWDTHTLDSSTNYTPISFYYCICSLKLHIMFTEKISSDSICNMKNKDSTLYLHKPAHLLYSVGHTLYYIKVHCILPSRI